MKVNGVPYRTIWVSPEDEQVVQIIDQRFLPHKFVIADLRTVEDVAFAIKEMQVRGAGLIGATAGYGMYIAGLQAPQGGYDEFLSSLISAGEKLKATRPTAVNLRWALDRMRAELQPMPADDRCEAAYRLAARICDEDVEINRRIGEHGLGLIRQLWE